MMMAVLSKLQFTLAGDCDHKHPRSSAWSFAISETGSISSPLVDACGRVGREEDRDGPSWHEGNLAQRVQP